MPAAHPAQKGDASERAPKVFSILFFLYYFLPCFLLLYWLCPAERRNGLCLLGSIFFYAWGEPLYILLMLASILANYGFGLLLGSCTGQRGRRLVLLLALLFDLGLLVLFKYSGFLLETLQRFSGLSFGIPRLALPLGISFFSFQAMSYLIDLYRGQAPLQRSLLKLALYIAAFPQLVAGPILRYSEVVAQIDRRALSLAAAARGVLRFCIGLGKKLLLANGCGALADGVFPLAGETAALGLWLGLLAYSWQIYFDFSGYSDMAIGLGLLLGFHYPENFRYPYAACSVTEFWRRWHISLSAWFRDYLYIPLGGNRRGRLRQQGNLLLVWLATGLWHGAGWTFLAWGLWHFLLLSGEKLLGPQRLEKLPGIFRQGMTLLLVMLGWLLFRAADLPQAGEYLLGLLNANGRGWLDAASILLLKENWLLLLAGAFGASPLLAAFGRQLSGRLSAHPLLEAGLCSLWALLLLALSTLCLVNSTYTPFIYFRF